MSDAPDPVVVDCDLDAPPETVWRALTEPELRARWLEEADACAEVVEAEPNERLRLAWRERDEAGALVESDVTFTLTPIFSGGTRLRLVHDGFTRTPTAAMARLPAALRRPSAGVWTLSRAA
jgi:uncharacterized protein YndB with AHSA1/START domain